MDEDKIIRFIKLIEENNFTLNEWNCLEKIINDRFAVILEKINLTINNVVFTLYGKEELLKSIETRQ